MTGAGARRERLTLQTHTAAAIGVSSLWRNGTVANATTATAHGFANGDYVAIAGAVPAGYTGTVQITLTGTSTFTYAVVNTLATPATGTITATFVRDAQGGTGGATEDWTTLRSIDAELVPVRASERLEAAAIQSSLDYRFRVNAMDAGGITAAMRALWTPQWPVTGRTAHTLEIHGVLPEGDGRHATILECGEIR